MPVSDVYNQRYLGNYRETLSGYEIARWEALEHFATRILKLGSATKVLDYGAGSGLHVVLWERIFPNAELNFCDISSVAMKKFKTKYERHADHYFPVSDDRANCNDAEYDVIVSVEVMEHVETLQLYLRDINRLLKPGGTFVWTTPCANRFSIEHLYSTITRAIEPTQEGYMRWKWEDPAHLRRLRSGEIKSLLLQNGFLDVCFRFRAHVFSFVCSRLPGKKNTHLRNRLMTLDYKLFRWLPNGASMIGAAKK